MKLSSDAIIMGKKTRALSITLLFIGAAISIFPSKARAGDQIVVPLNKLSKVSVSKPFNVTEITSNYNLPTITLDSNAQRAKLSKFSFAFNETYDGKLSTGAVVYIDQESLLAVERQTLNEEHRYTFSNYAIPFWFQSGNPIKGAFTCQILGSTVQNCTFIFTVPASTTMPKRTYFASFNSSIPVKFPLNFDSNTSFPEK